MNKADLMISITNNIKTVELYLPNTFGLIFPKIQEQINKAIITENLEELKEFHVILQNSARILKETYGEKK